MGNVGLRYLWQDQLRLAAELYPDGTIRKQFIYAEGVNSPEYMIFEGRKYFFVKDHRGSILQVVDVATGEVKQQMKYSEFGEVLQDTNPGFQPFGFAGGLYDHETRLVRFGARDYDGNIGRWLSKDPIGFKGGDTNLFGYVLNDPVNNKDQQGTGPILGIICAAADVAYNMGVGYAEYSSYMDQAAIYDQSARDMEMQMANNPCLDLRNQIAMTNVKKAEALALASKALLEAVGKSAGISLICSGIAALPGM